MDRCSRRARWRARSRAFALRTESWGSAMLEILPEYHSGALNRKAGVRWQDGIWYHAARAAGASLGEAPTRRGHEARRDQDQVIEIPGLQTWKTGDNRT